MLLLILCALLAIYSSGVAYSAFCRLTALARFCALAPSFAPRDIPGPCRRTFLIRQPSLAFQYNVMFLNSNHRRNHPHTMTSNTLSPLDAYKLNSVFGENNVTHAATTAITIWTSDKVLGCGAFGTLWRQWENQTRESRDVMIISQSQSPYTRMGDVGEFCEMNVIRVGALNCAHG